MDWQPQKFLRTLRLRVLKEESMKPFRAFFSDQQNVEELQLMLSKGNRGTSQKDTEQQIKMSIMKYAAGSSEYFPAERFWQIFSSMLNEHISKEERHAPKKQNSGRQNKERCNPTRNSGKKRSTQRTPKQEQSTPSKKKRRRTESTPSVTRPSSILKGKRSEPNSKKTRTPKKTGSSKALGVPKNTRSDSSLQKVDWDVKSICNQVRLHLLQQKTCEHLCQWLSHKENTYLFASILETTTSYSPKQGIIQSIQQNELYQNHTFPPTFWSHIEPILQAQLTQASTPSDIPKKTLDNAKESPEKRTQTNSSSTSTSRASAKKTYQSKHSRSSRDRESIVQQTSDKAKAQVNKRTKESHQTNSPKNAFNEIFQNAEEALAKYDTNPAQPKEDALRSDKEASTAQTKQDTPVPEQPITEKQEVSSSSSCSTSAKATTIKPRTPVPPTIAAPIEEPGHSEQEPQKQEIQTSEKSALDVDFSEFTTELPGSQSLPSKKKKTKGDKRLFSFFSSQKPKASFQPAHPTSRSKIYALALLVLLVPLCAFIVLTSTNAPEGQLVSNTEKTYKAWLPVSKVYRKKNILSMVLRTGWEKEKTQDQLEDKIFEYKRQFLTENVRFVRVYSQRGIMLCHIDLNA